MRYLAQRGSPKKFEAKKEKSVWDYNDDNTIWKPVATLQMFPKTFSRVLIRIFDTQTPPHSFLSLIIFFKLIYLSSFSITAYLSISLSLFHIYTHTPWVSDCLCVCLSVCLSISLSVYLCLSASLSFFLSVFLSLCVSLSLSVSVSFPLCVSQSFDASIYLFCISILPISFSIFYLIFIIFENNREIEKWKYYNINVNENIHD